MLLSNAVRRVLGLVVVVGLFVTRAHADTIASADEALTFSMVAAEAGYHTVLIVEDAVGKVRGIDLGAILGEPGANAFEILARHDVQHLRQLLGEHPLQDFARADLTILPLLGSTHIAAGTNYAEHQAETDSSEVFLFPKYSEPTAEPAVVAVVADGLLDYEVEICAIFDRDIASSEDFANARKGFFLCGDFTDRAQLLRRIDFADMGSGVGFTDAKSGKGRFPVGNRLVIPHDWRSFIDKTPVSLTLNFVRRQVAAGGDMILKLDQIVATILAQAGDDRWRYRGQPITLTGDNKIAAGQSVLTGTPGGVMFQIPSVGFFAAGIARWLYTMSWWEQSLADFLVEEFVRISTEAKTFLQPGDRVEMQAGPLGNMVVNITRPTG